MSTEGPLWRIFIVGGVRSGKSRFAQHQAKLLAAESPVRFVATARQEPGDESMQQRIERHRAERPDNWTTIEEPLDLAAAMHEDGDESVVLIDCLTLWLSNILVDCGDPDATGFRAAVERAVDSRLGDFVESLASTSRHVIVVSNEVGSGVAPPTRLGNVFADMQGMVNQRIAAASTEVYHMVAGIPTRIR